MNIKINKLTLTNFKCFRSKDFVFTNNVVTITGRNRSGKTTIADAILYCLFGKNSMGQTSFDLKTHDEYGNTFPHLDHSVEMELSVGDSIVTLKRTLKEKWTKKRGFSEQVLAGNDFEYMVNGDVVTAGDYKKYIASLISEDVFRTITNPTYFPSLKWQDQRNFLSKLAGDISPTDIAANDITLLDFIKILEQNGNDIVAYRKHLAYQIKQIKSKIDQMPIRLEELSKALPELQDWDALQRQHDELTTAIKDLQDKIAQVNAGDTFNVEAEELYKQSNRLMDELAGMEANIREELRQQQKDIDKNIFDTRKQFFDTSKNIADLTQKISGYDILVERCNETLSNCEADADKIRKQWKENERSRLEISDDATICPTCGQPLPEDKLTELVTRMRNTFAENKKRTTEELTIEAEKVKKLRADAENSIKEYQEQKKEDEERLSELKEALNNIQKALHAFEQEKVPTFDEAKEANEEYITLRDKVASLSTKRASLLVSDNSGEILKDFNEQKRALTEQLKPVVEQLAGKSQYERIQKMITDLKEEEKQLVSQLSEMEKQEDIAIQYQDRQNSLLEESINKHFKVVRWKLFKTVVNGGDSYQEPYCECYVDGTAYHDGLNSAARLNAGLDIINTLCKMYDVSAPIVIDNAESTLNFIPTIGQQIRLAVADNDLTIF